MMETQYADAVFGITDKQSVCKALRDQLQTLDLQLIRQLALGNQKQVDWAELARQAKPPKAFRVDAENQYSADQAIQQGQELLQEGKVAMILVAGGQGTRLGFDKPKGLFPIGPLSGRTLFQMFVDRIKALSTHYGATIPLYVMTSPATHCETIEYFEKNNHFGIADDDLIVFCQGTMPAVDLATGKLLRQTETEFALSPNGHGGMLDALVDSQCLQAAIDRGIQHFFYGQIDNPLVQICDEELIGYHALAQSDMTVQAVKKTHALEKVGNVVDINGRVQIIEYSDLPDQYALKTDDSNELVLWAGNIAVHIFSTNFLVRASQSTSSLPYHLAKKIVPYIDGQGNRQQPTEPNAIKFEKFIFDLLPIANNALAVEVEKSKGFAPVKNANGAETDTPSLASKAISDLQKGWLRENDVIISDDVTVEIHPSFAFSAASLANRSLPAKICEDTYLR
ncbi:MAG: UDPGP type 1 family protein [Planctomycetota bacterium]|nr:UDPGP type 1 family protein [Planctomycetota bacterium]